MICPLPRTGPSSRCRLQLMTKIRLSSFSREASVIAPSDLWFVGLAVAEECPHFRVRSLLEPAILQIAHEARLVDRPDGTETHRHRGEFPEVGHQPRMRVRREPASFLQFTPEVRQLLRREPAFEKRARVDARRRVSLEVDDVAVVIVALALEEVVEPDFVERGCRRVGRDVTADAVFELVGLDNHREGVPSDQALDPTFDLAATRKRWLIGGGNRVDVGRVRRKWLRHAVLLRVHAQRRQQTADSRRPTRLEHIVERLEPFARFERLDLCRVFGCGTAHESSRERASGQQRGFRTTRSAPGALVRDGRPHHP